MATETKKFEREPNGHFKQLTPKLLVGKPSIELAEFIGIMLGDGSVYSIPEKSIYQIKVAGNSEDDKRYLLDYVKPLAEQLFSLDFCVYFHKQHKELFVHKQSKSLAYTLNYFGFPPGNKTNNDVGIPDWIFENKDFLKACLRGLIDTDGSVCPKTKNHKTPTIWFSSAIPQLRKDFKKALNILGYTASKWVEKQGRREQVCSIGDRTQVWAYYTEIGFSNPKYVERFKKHWKLAPVV